MREPAAVMRVNLGGEAVELHPERALHWPRAATLFVADVHLGKAAAFRAGGVPLPRGSTADDLARLARLLARTKARRLVVLGDFLHARTGRVAALDAAMRAFRSAHAELDILLVRGNHDANAGDPPAHWGITVVAEPYALPPFLAMHDPVAPPSGHALGGHLHPGVRLADGVQSALRLPCFVLGVRRTILPAFGRFTGLALVTPETRDRIVAVAGTRLFAVPT